MVIPVITNPITNAIYDPIYGYFPSIFPKYASSHPLCLIPTAIKKTTICDNGI